MKNQDYQNNILVSVSPKEAIKKISHVSEWWAKDFEGKSENQNDIFTVQFKNGDMYKIKVAEIIPDKKIIWDVIDSYQGWHNNHTEWIGTKIIWEIVSKKDNIEVRMKHLGLVPEFECYDACNKGWSYLIEKSLLNLLNDGKGFPV